DVPSHVLFCFMIPLPLISTLFPYTTLFRSVHRSGSLSPAPSARQLAARGHRRPRHRYDGSPCGRSPRPAALATRIAGRGDLIHRSEEHTSELQSLRHLVCRLLLEKKKIKIC